MRITAVRAAGALLALLAAAVAAWSLMPRPTSVEVALVIKGPFVATIDEDGKTRIRDRYVVSAPLTGRLNRLQLKAGDRVEASDVVASITPSPAPLLDPRTSREAQERIGAAEAELNRARALVERGRAHAVQADQESTRTRALAERGASTVQALERAELAKHVAEREMRAAEFQLHAAEHGLDQARALVSRYTDNAPDVPETWNVTAPIAGVVLKVTQESETVVQPGFPILELGDARNLEVIIDVLSTDAVEIAAGARVIIERWGGSEALAGQVRRIEPAAFTKVSTLGVEEQRVNVLVDIVSPYDQWMGLGDAYQVDGKIVAFAKDDATIIPSGALFRRDGSWNVFVVEGGRAQVRKVTLLRRSGRIAAVSDGLAPGERVVVYPSDRIGAGSKVEAIR